MFDRDFWQEILSTFRSNKLRTGLTAAGVFWGIFMLILMMGIGKGMENGVMSEFGGTVTNGLFVWPGKTSIPYKGLGINRRFQFNLDDVEEISSKVTEIDLIAPRVELSGQNIVYGIEKGSYEVRGELPAVFSIQSMIPRNGRLLNDLDEKERRKVTVLGKTVAEGLFKNTDPIGKYVEINMIPFQVVGVIEYDGQGQWMQEVEEQVFIPLSSARQAFNFGENISWFVCTVKPSSDISITEEKVKAILAQRHRASPEDKQAIGSFNSAKEFGKIASLFNGVNVFIWFVGIMTLFAGVVSVSNVMLITVKDRTREIGLRKAIGASPSSIIIMIMTESVVLTTISGYIGLIAGTGLVALADYFLNSFGEELELFKNPQIQSVVALGSLLILVISGTLAGLLPARYASRIEPIAALRTD